MPSPAEIADRARAVVSPRGFDLVQPFDVGAYNRGALPEHRLPDFSRGGALGLLIGNTRALWPALRSALLADRELARDPHPLDRYTMRTVDALVTDLALPALARFAHDLEPCPIPIQRIAQAAGLAWLSPSHLSVHREHGVWIALRAVIAVDAPAPERHEAAVDTCTACSKPCMAALERAVARSTEPKPHDWRPWLAVRDACPIGRDARYSDEQIEYHYSRMKGVGR